MAQSEYMAGAVAQVTGIGETSLPAAVLARSRLMAQAGRPGFLTAFRRSA